MKSMSETYKTYTIAVDFDGTCVKHEYPRIGADVGAVPVLKALTDAGHKLILYTMRSNEELAEAIKWFDNNKIPLYGINENPTQKRWTSSPKVYADCYIDDAAIGTPLVKCNKSAGYRDYVDWEKIKELLWDQMMVWFDKEE